MIPVSGDLAAAAQTSDVKAGLALLALAPHWWDIHNSPPTVVDVGFTPNVTTWSKINVAVASGIADPTGGTGAYRVSSLAAGNAYIQYAGSNMAAGYAKLSGYTRYLEAAPNTGSFTIDTSVSPNGSSRLTVLKPSAETGAENIPYFEPTAGANKCVGWLFEPVAGSDWRKFSIESVVRDDSGAVYSSNIGRMRCDAATAAGDLFELYDLTFTQKRVTSVSARAGAADLSQATNANKMTVAPGAWLGRDAVVVAPRSAQVVSATITSVTDANFCVYGVVSVSRVEGFLGGTADAVFSLTGAGSTSLKLTAVPSAAGNEYQGAWGWSWTDTAGTTLSGTFAGTHIAPVPVAVALQYEHATQTLRLYVDGLFAGSASVAGTSSFSATTFSVLGRETQLLWTSWAIVGTHSTDQVRQTSLALRQAAGLPSHWKLIHWSGQSNATASSGLAVAATRGAGFCAGNAFFRWEEEGASFAPWTPAPSTRYWSGPASVTAGYWGSAQTFLEEARKAGEFGLCVVGTGRGGTGIDSWMSVSASHAMYTATRAAWAAALARFGTHLVERHKTVWIHGEADASGGTLYPGGYGAALGNLVYEDNTDFKGPSDILLLKLSKYFTSADPTSMRALQDTFAAQMPHMRAVASADFADSTPGVTLYDGIHFSTRGERKMGEILYAKHAQKAGDPSTYASCKMFFSAETITRNPTVTSWKSPVGSYSIGPVGTPTFVKGWRNDRDAVLGVVDGATPSCMPATSYGPTSYLFIGALPSGTTSGQYYGCSGNFSPDKCYPVLVYDNGTNLQLGWAPRDGEVIRFADYPKSMAGTPFAFVYRSQTGGHRYSIRIGGSTTAGTPLSGGGYVATSGLSMLSLGSFYGGGGTWGSPMAAFAAFNEGLTDAQLLSLIDWAIWYAAL
jgi:hypothetical protein